MCKSGPSVRVLKNPISLLLTAQILSIYVHWISSYDYCVVPRSCTVLLYAHILTSLFNSVPQGIVLILPFNSLFLTFESIVGKADPSTDLYRDVLAIFLHFRYELLTHTHGPHFPSINYQTLLIKFFF